MGIFLEKDELREMNDKYSYRRILIEKLRRKGEPSPFIACEECHGTGLDDVNYHQSGESWSGMFCSKCRGEGLFDVFEDMMRGLGLLNEKK